MTEQVGRDPQGLKDDNADFMEDAHHISMQPIRPESIAPSDTTIRQPDREIVAEAGFLISANPADKAANRILGPAGFREMLLVIG
jgi:hypothetical protein